MKSYQEKAKHFFTEAHGLAQSGDTEAMETLALLSQTASMLAIMEDVHAVRAIIQKSEEEYQSAVASANKHSKQSP